MKKYILFITLFWLLSIFNTSNASWACPIKDNTAQALLDYIKNNNTVIKNVTDSIVSDKWYREEQKQDLAILEQIEKDFKKAKRETESIFNQMFNFSWYYSYFNYFAVFPISTDVPFEVKRDYRLLDSEAKSLIKYLNKIEKKEFFNIIVTDPCKWVSADYCTFDDNRAKSIIGKLIENNDRVLDLYRLTVMWEAHSFDLDTELNLTDENFFEELQANYKTEIMSACNSEKWGFMDQISKAIDNIKSLQEQAEGWIEKWQDAIALLLWERPDEERKLERELLLQYLKESWVSAENQEIMLQNLEKYNAWEVDENNRFVSNSIKSIWDKLEKVVQKWKKELFWDYARKKGWINLNEKRVVISNSEKSKEIQERIAKLYESEIPAASIEDQTTAKLRARIIKTHLNINSWIKTLEETINIAERVCDKPDAWKWKCRN